MGHGWDERQEKTRAEVLSAVGALIVEGGVDHLTMRRLAERAGVAVATLYNQFGDRAGVIVAFVSSGLDALERRVDAQPAAGPIDATRALFLALDDTVLADQAVWRPVFAMLHAAPSIEGLGAVGDRFVARIDADLGKALADGRFTVSLDTERLARHLFGQRMRVLERWAAGSIEWDEYLEIAGLGTELSLAAVLIEPHRANALARCGLVPDSATPAV